MTTPTMVLMVGLPGSGKSTLARDNGDRLAHIYSTDDFWRQHELEFDRELLGEAHRWNQGRVEAAAALKVRCIVVDDTNLTCPEMQPYMDIANRHGYLIEFRTPEAWWNLVRCLASQLHVILRMLSSRSTDDVPLETMWGMLSRWAIDNEAHANIVENPVQVELMRGLAIACDKNRDRVHVTPSEWIFRPDSQEFLPPPSQWDQFQPRYRGVAQAADDPIDVNPEPEADWAPGDLRWHLDDPVNIDLEVWEGTHGKSWGAGACVVTFGITPMNCVAVMYCRDTAPQSREQQILPNVPAIQWLIENGCERGKAIELVEKAIGRVLNREEVVELTEGGSS